MGNRQGAPTIEPKEQLRSTMKQIASTYILKAPFSELRQLASYNQKQLESYVFLTAEILNKTMSDREIEYLYTDIRGRPKITTEPVIFFKPEDAKGLDVPNAEKKRRLAVGIARFYVRILQLYAAIIDTLDPEFFTDLDSPREYAVERLAHDYRADDASGNRTAYHFSEVPAGTGAEGGATTYKKLLTPMSLCGRRLWALTDSKTETFDVEENTDQVAKMVRIKNHICDLHTNKSVRSMKVAEKNPQPGVQVIMVGAPQQANMKDKIIRGPKAMKFEMGINSLEQLFLNSYNLMTGKFEFVGTPPSADRPQRVDMNALTQYRTLIQRYSTIFGDTSRGSAPRLSEIVLSPIHAQPYCRGSSNPKNKDPDADALLNHSILVSSASPKLAAYLATIKKMKSAMDGYRKRLLTIINGMFVRIVPGQGSNVPPYFTLNPRLTERTLEGLVEQTRTILAEMYAKCHIDFMEAVRIFVDIASDTKSGMTSVERSEADAVAGEGVTPAVVGPVPVVAARAAVPAPARAPVPVLPRRL